MQNEIKDKYKKQPHAWETLEGSFSDGRGGCEVGGSKRGMRVGIPMKFSEPLARDILASWSRVTDCSPGGPSVCWS